MQLYLTRQHNGLYMLTKLKPTFADVQGTDFVDAYIQPGEPIGIRNLCNMILVVLGINSPMKRCTTIEIELTGAVVTNLNPLTNEN